MNEPNDKDEIVEMLDGEYIPLEERKDFDPDMDGYVYEWEVRTDD